MEYVMDIIYILLLVGGIALLAHIVDTFRGKKVADKMSFREAMDLTGLPIVTFKQGDKKFNFILDTGAYSSLIDSRVLCDLDYTPIKGSSVGYGIDGKEHTMERVGIVLSYKDKNYSDVFRVLDMTTSFDSFKRDFGVTVHGLLSSSFFERYKYVLDYKELIAYSSI